MPMTVAGARAWVTRYRVHSEALGVSLLALIVFVVLGIQARRALQPVRADLTRLGLASSEITSFRSAFKASTPEQEMRVRQLAESLSVVIPRDYRVALAQQIAARAESLGLGDVRVRFAPLDTAAPPPRPDLSGSTVAVADYSLSVDCSGGYAAVLSLIKLLPSSVALQQIVGDTAGGHTQFHLALAVFESANMSAPAPAGSH